MPLYPEQRLHDEGKSQEDQFQYQQKVVASLRLSYVVSVIVSSLVVSMLTDPTQHANVEVLEQAYVTARKLLVEIDTLGFHVHFVCW